MENMDAADMEKDTPAADAAATALWKEKMWEKRAEYITEAHSMTVLSLIPHMIGENLWSLYAAQV